MKIRMKKGIGGILLALIMITSVAAVIPMAIGGDIPDNGEVGTGTPGYWKNHPDAWPVDVLTIGGVNYNKSEAIGFMNTPEKGDKTYTMFRALAAAQLNLWNGANTTCIEDTMLLADSWMGAHNFGVEHKKVKGKSEAWKQGEPLYELLDAYNNGNSTCAPSRD
jgi:hypothetical protein